MRKRPKILILGIRGIPAAHGGFETFAERLALYLCEREWDVTVYCQGDSGASESTPSIDSWNGIRRITFPSNSDGPVATMKFDWQSVMHALKEPGLLLVLGYNTAIFNLVLRFAGRPLLMNMDGIEWKRDKWSLLAKAWFYLNERIGCVISTKLIADHPRIADHLATRRKRDDIITIPYGGDEVLSASPEPLKSLNLSPDGYFISIARIEPENSILEMIKAYTCRDRSKKFVCLGKLDPQRPYHAKILEASNGKVLFPGPIYDPTTIRSLRFYAFAYCHGHTVGGTNPSLVEAMGAGSAIIAHDNQFNKWVAGEKQFYFNDTSSLDDIFTNLEADSTPVTAAREASRIRFHLEFTWSTVLQQYEGLCSHYTQIPVARHGVGSISTTREVLHYSEVSRAPEDL